MIITGVLCLSNFGFGLIFLNLCVRAFWRHILFCTLVTLQDFRFGSVEHTDDECVEVDGTASIDFIYFERGFHKMMKVENQLWGQRATAGSLLELQQTWLRISFFFNSSMWKIPIVENHFYWWHYQQKQFNCSIKYGRRETKSAWVFQPTSKSFATLKFEKWVKWHYFW